MSEEHDDINRERQRLELEREKLELERQKLLLEKERHELRQSAHAQGSPPPPISSSEPPPESNVVQALYPSIKHKDDTLHITVNELSPNPDTFNNNPAISKSNSSTTAIPHSVGDFFANKKLLIILIGYLAFLLFYFHSTGILTLLFISLYSAYMLSLVRKTFAQNRRLGLIFASVLISLWFLAGISSETTTSSGDRPQAQTSSPSSSSSNDRDLDRLDIDDKSACISYLRGRTFSGGTARIRFGMGSDVSVYDDSGQLVFGGYYSVGEKFGQASRAVTLSAVGGGGTIPLHLQSDGTIFEGSSGQEYRP